MPSIMCPLMSCGQPNEPTLSAPWISGRSAWIGWVISRRWGSIPNGRPKAIKGSPLSVARNPNVAFGSKADLRSKISMTLHDGASMLIFDCHQVGDSQSVGMRICFRKVTRTFWRRAIYPQMPFRAQCHAGRRPQRLRAGRLPREIAFSGTYGIWPTSETSSQY
jgi:hypothetical protein